MLGHTKPAIQDNIFKLMSNTLTNNNYLIDIFILYSSRYNFLPSLVKIIGKSEVIRFLDIFANTVFTVPKLSAIEHMTKYQNLTDIKEIFGEEVYAKFIQEFRNSVVKIPSVATMHGSIRDVDIYLKIMSATSAVDRKKIINQLATHYGERKNEIHWIFRRVAKVLNPAMTEAELNSYMIPDEEIS